ncbi:hypothetical protein H920_03346 [Fukomys damarensis]|uniref:Uncharacterized protein n=1 Tax=Fukomys damarensis TaxID=885580 RepID=A0A091EID4_FUKDA|nr:hypothetical protein H920_03346 [Fukomys damarensis]
MFQNQGFDVGMNKEVSSVSKYTGQTGPHAASEVLLHEEYRETTFPACLPDLATRQLSKGMPGRPAGGAVENAANTFCVGDHVGISPDYETLVLTVRSGSPETPVGKSLKTKQNWEGAESVSTLPAKLSSPLPSVTQLSHKEPMARGLLPDSMMVSIMSTLKAERGWSTIAPRVEDGGGAAVSGLHIVVA